MVLGKNSYLGYVGIIQNQDIYPCIPSNQHTKYKKKWHRIISTYADNVINKFFSDISSKSYE